MASALSSTAPAETRPGGKQSLFIFGIGYVATAIALTYLRQGWAVHGTCTDPRKVKSLGDQGIKVGSHRCGAIHLGRFPSWFDPRPRY